MTLAIGNVTSRCHSAAAAEVGRDRSLPVSQRAAGSQPPTRYSAAVLADALGRPRPTPEQAAVIEAPLAPTLVVAGAGSGKTETMASRVVWLAANGWCRPDQVLGLTFTRKAASELGHRIAQRLRSLRDLGITSPLAHSGLSCPAGLLAEPGHQPQRPTPNDDEEGAAVLTYHAFANRLLAEQGGWVGVDPGFRLLSAASAWQFAHQVVSRWDGPMTHVNTGPAAVTRAVLSLSAELAEHLCDEDSLDELLENIETTVCALPAGSARSKGLPKDVALLLQGVRARREILPVIREYRALKDSHGALDFADQVSAACRLVRTEPTVCAGVRQTYRVVLLDEVQDTSEAQLMLLHDLFVRPDDDRGAPIPVTAVGDPHQAIYGWRGASATTMRRFADTFGTSAGRAVVRHLSTSWRNDEAILTAANTIAGPLRDEALVPVRRLVPRPQAEAGTVSIARLTTQEEEAEHVASWVAARRSAGASSTAVLCRRRSQMGRVVQALQRRGLEVNVVGLGGLLTTPEVADQVALLTVAHDPDRAEALIRLLTGPVCRLGVADLDGVTAWSRSAGRHADPTTDDSLPDWRNADPSTKTRTPPAPGSCLTRLLDTIPPVAWRGPDGESISAEAVSRLTELVRAVETVRAVSALSLTDQALAAERALSLDMEADSLPSAGQSVGRVALDAFLDVVVDFERSVENPTMSAFIDWLDVARVEERNLDLPSTPTDPEAVQVLTVHAAKGLEWDAVAVLGLVEGVFPAYTTRSRPTATSWECAAPTDRGWCSRTAELPFDLRGDREALPHLPWRESHDLAELARALKEAAQDGGRHLLAEERRLMYVAATRARSHLLLTASVWTEATTPRVTSRFLQEVKDGVAGVTGPASKWVDMPDPAAPAGSHNSGSAGRSSIWPAHRAEPESVVEAGRLVRSFLTGLASDERRPQAARTPGDTLGGPARQLAGRAFDPAGPGGVVGSGAACDDEESFAAQADPPACCRNNDLTDSPGGTDMSPSRNERNDLIRALLGTRERSWASRRDQQRSWFDARLSVSELALRHQDPGEFHRCRQRPMPRRPDPRAAAGEDFHRWVAAYYRPQPWLLNDDAVPDCEVLWGRDPALKAATTADLRFLDSALAAGPTENDWPAGSVEGDLAARPGDGIHPLGGGTYPASGDAFREPGQDEELSAWRAAFLASPWATRQPVFCELSVDTVIGGSLVRGRIDAVFRGEDGGFVIVDWKTGKVPAGRGGLEHAVQLAAYRLGFARWVGVPPHDVRVACFYAETGTTHWVDIDGLGLDSVMLGEQPDETRDAV